jgi:hypothetical protein
VHIRLLLTHASAIALVAVLALVAWAGLAVAMPPPAATAVTTVKETVCSR